MTSRQVKITLKILLLTTIVFASPSLTWAVERPKVIAIQNKCGLEVRVPNKTIDLGNLNPGDSKESSIQVSNKGSNDITLFIRTNILDETTLKGGYLADIMNFTININRDIIAKDSFRGVVDQENILIGILKPGTSKILDLATYLPGEGTGNLYQGAYMKVSWIFVTQCSSPEGGGNSDGPNIPNSINDTDTPLQEIIIEDELIPLGQDDVPGERPEQPKMPDVPKIEVEDDKVPFGGFKMPKTGQLASVYFYGIGATLITLGVSRKKE